MRDLKLEGLSIVRRHLVLSAREHNHHNSTSGGTVDHSEPRCSALITCTARVFRGSHDHHDRQATKVQPCCSLCSYAVETMSAA